MRLFDSKPAYPRSEAAIRQWIQERNQARDAFIFGIRLLTAGELLGHIELDGVLWTHRVCGIGLAIGDPNLWARNYGSEATRLALEFAFHELNLHRVTLTVFDYNERSIALAEKMGFKREGTFREFLERDGERHDMLLYGLLRPEWLESRRAE
jgi:RimJ/RimL family protein N-acetyltransferase